MAAPRLHLDAALSEGARLDLDPDQARYLVGVLRLRPGDEARVFNARDGEWTATIAAAGKKKTMLAIGARRRAPAPAAVDLHLLFAPVKRTRTDFIVEKATELGVTAIRPVMTARTNAERVRVDRLAAIAREAAEQSERLDVPEVREAETLDRVLGAWEKSESGRRLLFLDEAAGGDGSPWREENAGAPPALAALLAARGEPAAEDFSPTPPLRRRFAPPPPPHAGEEKLAPPLCSPASGGAVERSETEGGRDQPALLAIGPSRPWAVLIGPEGGFAPEERARLRSLPFVTPASLGPRILRADTAAVAALSLWQAALGDWM